MAIARVWPGRRIPRLYSEPRAFRGSGPARTSSHGKWIAVDEHTSVVTSGICTQAAYLRGTEVGLVVDGLYVVQLSCARFANLVRDGALHGIPLSSAPPAVGV